MELQQRLANAEHTEQRARVKAQQCAADREESSSAIRAISESYHAYDLTTGAKRNRHDVEWQLTDSFDRLDKLADRVGLSQNARKRIDKAWRVVDQMLDTVAWTHVEIEIRLSKLQLLTEELDAVRCSLIPGMYLMSVATKSRLAERRRELESRGKVLIAAFDRALSNTPPTTERRQQLVATAQYCAQSFQRSSSCVEGRNGHLSLFHHGIHRLRPKKLRGLTVTHNFHITRVDGSTAAERLFGATHPPLFETVFGRLPPCKRSAKKRSQRSRRGVQNGTQHAVWAKR